MKLNLVSFFLVTFMLINIICYRIIFPFYFYCNLNYLHSCVNTCELQISVYMFLQLVFNSQVNSNGSLLPLKVLQTKYSKITLFLCLLASSISPFGNVLVSYGTLSFTHSSLTWQSLSILFS